MKLHLKPSREITQKVCKREMSFLYATHYHDLFYMNMKYHDNSQGHVSDRAGTNMHKNIRGDITQNILKQELSFLYAIHRHDLF